MDNRVQKYKMIIIFLKHVLQYNRKCEIQFDTRIGWCMIFKHKISSFFLHLGYIIIYNSCDLERIHALCFVAFKFSDLNFSDEEDPTHQYFYY